VANFNILGPGDSADVKDAPSSNAESGTLRRALTFRTRFPRGATRNIVGPFRPTDGGPRTPNNIANGTSAAREPDQPVIQNSSFLV